MNKLEDAMKLLPISLQSDPVVVAMFEATIIQLQELYDEAMMIVDFVNIDKLPEDLLDLIAFEKHVDFYDIDLSLEQKRALVKQNISWHRKKGTRWALEHVVSIVMPNSQVREWFEYDGRPYFFRLETEQALSPDMNFNQIYDAVNKYKNVRSWLENITVHRKIDLGLNIGTAYPLYQKTVIKPASFTMPDLSIDLKLGGVHAAYAKTTLLAPSIELPNFDFGHYFGGAICIYKKTVID